MSALQALMGLIKTDSKQASGVTNIYTEETVKIRAIRPIQPVAASHLVQYAGSTEDPYIALTGVVLQYVNTWGCVPKLLIIPIEAAPTLARQVAAIRGLYENKFHFNDYIIPVVLSLEVAHKLAYVQRWNIEPGAFYAAG